MLTMFGLLKAVKFQSGVSVWLMTKEERCFLTVYSTPFYYKHRDPNKDHRWTIEFAISQPLAQKILERTSVFTRDFYLSGAEYYWTDEIPVDSERQFFEFLKIDVELKKHEYEQTKHYYQHPTYYYDLKGAQ